MYRRLLKLYPKSFRTAHEDDAIELFVERYRDEFGKKGRWGLVAFWIRTLRNVLWHGPAEHLSQPGARPRRTRASGSGLAGDIRSAFRALRAVPTFTLGVAGILSLGLGATLFVFALLQGVLLRPLPFPEADRLVQLHERNEQLGLQEGPSPWNFDDVRRLSNSLESAAAWYLTSATFRDDEQAEELREARVTTDFFKVLRVTPTLGRDFVAEDPVPLGPVILSDGLWRRLFGEGPEILGQTIELSGRLHEVVGIMPPTFQFPDASVEYWVVWDIPTTYAGNPDSRTWRFLSSVGRLQPGVSLEGAQADLQAVYAGLANAYPGANRGWGGRVTSLHDEVLGEVRGSLVVAMGCVLFVLLLTCANVANLLLARAPARATEFAVRSALGAGRARLGRQLAIENAGLAVLGGVLGVPLAWGLIRIVQAYGANNIPRLDEVGVDLALVAFAGLVLGLTSVVFGLAPLVHLVRDPVATLLRRGGGRSGGALNRVRSGFVAAQVALALVLLVGAGLTLTSLSRVRGVDLGFTPEQALTFRVSLDPQRLATAGPDGIADYYDRLMRRLGELPNVSAVGAGQTLPMSPVATDFTRPYRSMGSETPSAEAATVAMRMVTPGYFGAAGMRFSAGAPFTGEEQAGGPLVAVVNRTLASQLWPEGSPVGESFELDFREGWQPYRVVGVAEDVLHHGPKGQATPEVFLSHRQIPYLAMSVVVRTSAVPEVMVPVVRSTVLSVAPGQPAYSFESFETLVASTTALDRLLAFLLLVFAGASLGLAAAGVYSVVAYSVSSRAKELGVRMALGAESGLLVGEVTNATARTAIVGVAVGVLVALVVSQGLEPVLFEVRAVDPVILIAAAAGLLGVAVVAGFVSARKITALDPVATLRGSG